MRTILSLAILFTVCLGITWAGNDYIIEPGFRVGLITAKTNESDLIHVYGSSNVSRANIEVGEGMTDLGTTLFANDHERRIDITYMHTKLGENYRVGVKGLSGFKLYALTIGLCSFGTVFLLNFLKVNLTLHQLLLLFFYLLSLGGLAQTLAVFLITKNKVSTNG